MSRRLKVKRVFKNRVLWRVYAALAVVLMVATTSMSVFFLWRLPNSDVLDSASFLNALFWSNVLGVGSALLFGWWITRTVRASLEEITQVAQSITCGDYGARVRKVRNDDFGILGLTLNILGEELSDRMAALSRERAQLQAMLAGMVEGIIAVSDDDKILFSNRAADDLLKVEVSSQKGKPINELTGMGVLLPLIIEARSASNRIQREINMLDGSDLRTLDIKATRFVGDLDGGVVVVVHDITELRRLERVRKDFVANVSHELKTPLTSVKGFVETLQNGAKNEPLVLDRFLGKIESNVVRLVNLVQDILSLASVDGHDGKFQSERVDVNQVISQVVSRYDSEIKKRSLILNIVSSQPQFVSGDFEAMTQVVENLFSNAIKYSKEGGTVELTLKKVSGEVLLEVRDTGVGIPQEHLSRIFERFYRVDKARSRELGGTGLGLSIVKHLVAAMNGRVLVESHVGKGSVFTVALKQG
ncbi:MAG: ATP-binding protein [Proteobacteria bacterium]|nr:ATP-binding protein [Pseudomonadota bacterium]